MFTIKLKLNKLYSIRNSYQRMQIVQLFICSKPYYIRFVNFNSLTHSFCFVGFQLGPRFKEKQLFKKKFDNSNLVLIIGVSIYKITSYACMRVEGMNTLEVLQKIICITLINLNKFVLNNIKFMIFIKYM